ncbi:MAG TPA: aminotransferase class V-fold PLP-dependent enzyme [Polyangiaceae bacterium]|nr:aminotransferase class V-fold PLP-dependent enzyme [Polyangiaceae bacterium]
MSSERVELGNRSLFPTLEADAYLSHAAISPVSSRVARAVQEVTSDYARRGQAAFLDWHAQRERLREKLAAFLGTSPENVALATGTTRAISSLALSLPWQRGDTVLLYDGEFPANVSPWQSVAKLFGLELGFLPKPDPRLDEEALLAPLSAALAHGARLVAVSAVEFQTGLSMPLAAMAALCHAHGAELAVDAIQAVGVMPLDVTALDVDYLVGGAHKWLMGMEGAGYVYAKTECARALEPRTAGWLSHEDGTRFLFHGPGELRYDRPLKRTIQVLENGSASALSFAALEAGLDPLLELTPPAIFAHVTRYLDALQQGLVERGLSTLRSAYPERRSGILSVVPPAGSSAAELALALRQRRIQAATPDGLLRFAPHFPNALSEVPLVLDALDDALRAHGR